jgi:molecular chaperone IbpA
MVMMNYDFAPLWRTTVGFDRLFDMLGDDAFRIASEQNYPPFNIERTGEDSYEVSLAVAGFKPDEITITAEHNVLTIEGRKAEKTDRHYLHQGISARAFRRQFNLADYVKVSEAAFDNGLLQIKLVREIPESMKPRQIPINTGTHTNKQMEHQKAA